MKSRDRRALDFMRIILSFSSSPDFSTKNVRICDKYVSELPQTHSGLFFLSHECMSAKVVVMAMSMPEGLI